MLDLKEYKYENVPRECKLYEEFEKSLQFYFFKQMITDVLLHSHLS